MQLYQYSRMVQLQQVMSASDDSTYNFDRVIVDVYFHLHEFALLHHTDLMISNAANSAVIVDNSCCLVQVVAVARSLREVNKAGCMMMDCNKTKLKVGAVGVEFDCVLDLACRMRDGYCNGNHTCFDYCANVMVADNEMKSLAELSDVLVNLRELNKHMSL